MIAKERVVLVDDHAILREGLKLLVNAQPDMTVVGEAGDGRSAVAQAQSLVPDIIVMDISMPQLNGLEATMQLTATMPAVKVLVLSVHADSNYMRHLFAAGAKGYVLKRSAGNVLIQALRTVAAGELYLDPLLTGAVITDLVKPTARAGDLPLIELSERETEVLRLVARGYISKEIAEQLGVNSKTVDTYKARAMEKLGLNSRAAIVRYALQQGWLQGSSG
jgi:two-component system, NarL family, response regulator NreC